MISVSVFDRHSLNTKNLFNYDKKRTLISKKRAYSFYPEFDYVTSENYVGYKKLDFLKSKRHFQISRIIYILHIKFSIF